MVCFTGEVPVFADTSLGTCMSMAVSPDITTGDLKSKKNPSLSFVILFSLSYPATSFAESTNFVRSFPFLSPLFPLYVYAFVFPQLKDSGCFFFSCIFW
uniref:Uncharacterized protein n=1 Tax=Nelumbo nucifera TaxID=4432 RepID=A0A822Y1Z5_NELNU|nr:TPA_asm: hypothetical protein HUJ06_025141 [Nelumbo nucifera]